MARALQDILTELQSVYEPQRQGYQKQIESLDPQMAAENQGLEAQKADSFSQITSGANRRGLLFSGIPLEEQARYTGSSFLPAVANLRAKYAQQKFNLQDALAQLTSDQYTKGQSIYQSEMDRDQSAANARMTAGSAGGGYATPSFGYDFNGGAAGANAGAVPKATTPQAAHQSAFNAAQALLDTKDVGRIARSYKAIEQSARNGNANDKLILQFLAQQAPQAIADSGYRKWQLDYLRQFTPSLLQSGSVSSNAIGNAKQLSF